MHFVNTERINKVVIHFKSSSIYVFSVAAVQSAEHRLSDRLHRGGQTGGGDRRRRQVQELISAVRPDFNLGQTDDLQAIRSAHTLRSDHDPSNLMITFISAKSFSFWVYQSFTPLLVGLVTVIRSYNWELRRTHKIV